MLLETEISRSSLFLSTILRVQKLHILREGIIMRQNRHKFNRLLFVMLAALILAIGVVTNVKAWCPVSQLVGYDINYVYIEGQRLLASENPYSRILAGDMRTNQKYATYFPVYYELSALTQLAGLQSFEEWVTAWRGIFLAFNIGIFLLLLRFVDPFQRPWTALFASTFWILNRWTLDVSHIAHIEFPALFFLVLAAVTFKTKPGLAAYALGFSLGLKQIGILVVPLFLIEVWNSQPAGVSRVDQALQVVRFTLKMIAIPLVAAIPFLIWDFSGFVKSILFSVTRNAGGHFDVLSAGEILGFDGPSLRFALLGVLLFIYVANARRELKLITAIVFVMATFIDFNPVLFRQYFVWLIPFLPLLAVELATRDRTVI
jgi:hypothetical protein